MIVDEDLDEATVQDALRILNELQTGLSVPYKQRKQIGVVPTEKQARKMLKDMHVLEVQCLEVAAIAYHFGRKCKLYKAELDQVRGSPDLQERDAELHGLAQKHRQSLVVEALQDVQTGEETLHAIAELRSDVQGQQDTVEEALSQVKQAVDRLDTQADQRSEDLKSHIAKSFKDLERLLLVKSEESDSIAALSIRESLQSQYLNEREPELSISRCISSEIRPGKKTCRHNGVQTVDIRLPDRKVTIQTPRRLQIDSFSCEIPAVLVPELTLCTGKTLFVAGERKHQSSLRQIEPSVRHEKQIATFLVCNVPAYRPNLELYSCLLPAITGNPKKTEFWQGGMIEIQPETSGRAAANPFILSEDEDSAVQTDPALLSLQTLPSLSLQAATPSLSICVCDPVAISSWSLLEVFTFSTEDSVKEEEDVTPRKRPRRKVVRKDPIEEFFMLTLQAAKLNQPQRENVPRVDAEALYRRAIQEGIPFNRWSEWLHQILRISGQKTPR